MWSDSNAHARESRPSGVSLLVHCTMAQRRFEALQNDPNIARFVVEGTTTGRQLGIGSYGSVEEVCWRLE